MIVAPQYCPAPGECRRPEKSPRVSAGPPHLGEAPRRLVPWVRPLHSSRVVRLLRSHRVRQSPLDNEEDCWHREAARLIFSPRGLQIAVGFEREEIFARFVEDELFEDVRSFREPAAVIACGADEA